MCSHPPPSLPSAGVAIKRLYRRLTETQKKGHQQSPIQMGVGKEGQVALSAETYTTIAYMVGTQQTHDLAGKG